MAARAALPPSHADGDGARGRDAHTPPRDGAADGQFELERKVPPGARAREGRVCADGEVAGTHEAATLDHP